MPLTFPFASRLTPNSVFQSKNLFLCNKGSSSSGYMEEVSSTPPRFKSHKLNVGHLEENDHVGSS